MDTLYYDGRCSLCAREIRSLRRLQRGGLDFADIHQQAPEANAGTPGREALLRRLHLQTGSGDWVVGLPANVRAWSHTPLGWLFRPLLWPGLHRFANRVYCHWADRRYQRKYACASCDIPR